MARGKPIEVDNDVLSNYFEQYVLKKDGCWDWKGPKDVSSGYSIAFINYEKHMAHRVSYQIHKGDLGHGKHIDHLCRNESCVNPSHLELVTTKENTLRGIGPTAVNKRKVTCGRGHKFSHCATKDGKLYRVCKICKKEKDAASYQRLKQKAKEIRGEE